MAGTGRRAKRAKLTGLTTGAITGLIDRLEKAGFARRDVLGGASNLTVEAR